MKPQRIAGRRVVASVSGGADSAAMSLHLRELGVEHDRVFLNTGWEHRLTYEHLRGELTAKLGPIVEVKPQVPDCDPETIAPEHALLRAAAAGGAYFVLLALHKAMLPSRVMRFCTTLLKVEPMQRYIRARADAGEDLLNVVGIRRDESPARADMAEWEWADGFDCEVWRPLVTWSREDVIKIHQRHGLRPNPLYLLGASRVGCWPCIHARKSEIALVAERDPERIELIRQLEAELNRRALARVQARGEAALKHERTYFSMGGGGRGHRALPILDAVAWARGPGQGDLLAGAGINDGCMRWGLCETAGDER